MNDYIGEGVISVVIVGVLALFIWVGVQDAKDWKQYQIDHHCVVSGKKSGQTSVGVGVGSGGQVSVVPVYTAPQDIYRCDGDEIIIR